MHDCVVPPFQMITTLVIDSQILEISGMQGQKTWNVACHSLENLTPLLSNVGKCLTASSAGHLPAPLHDTHEVRTVKRPEGLPCTLEDND